MLLGPHPTTRNDFPGTVFPSPHSARIPATARTLLAIPVPTPVPTNAGDPCTVDFNDTFVHSQPVVCGAWHQISKFWQVQQRCWSFVCVCVFFRQKWKRKVDYIWLHVFKNSINDCIQKTLGTWINFVTFVWFVGQLISDVETQVEEEGT